MKRPVFRTRLCDMLGIDYPIMLAAMAPDVSDPRLVAAVSEAGGIGVLACADKTPDEIRDLVKETKKLTGKPFGIDVGLPIKAKNFTTDYRKALELANLPKDHVIFRDGFMDEHDIPYDDDTSHATPGMSSIAAYKLSYELGQQQVRAILDLKPTVFVSALGDPSFMVDDAHAAGIKVMSVIGKTKDAMRVGNGGVDAVIATGTAAGGHSGEVDGTVLVPAVSEAVAPTPVVAGGGVTNGRSLAGMLALGAIGAWVGSRFIASEECSVPDWYKGALVNATDTSTVRNRWFTGKTTRHINSDWDKQCDASGLEALPMPEQGILVTPMTIGAAQVGRQEDSGIYCGQGTARITEVLPAAAIIEEMIESATEILARELPARVAYS